MAFNFEGEKKNGEEKIYYRDVSTIMQRISYKFLEIEGDMKKHEKKKNVNQIFFFVFVFFFFFFFPSCPMVIQFVLIFVIFNQSRKENKKKKINQKQKQTNNVEKK